MIPIFIGPLMVLSIFESLPRAAKENYHGFFTLNNFATFLCELNPNAIVF